MYGQAVEAELEASKEPKIGNGSLKLPMPNGKYFVIYGGPAVSRPPDMFAVKMAKEIPWHELYGRKLGDVDIPAPDFQTPNLALLDIGVGAAVQHILNGEPLYVGCMAGRGRTGLMLAVLAKTFGVTNPVEYIRENYYPHAVETQGQYMFVMNYEAPASVVKAIAKAGSRTNWRTWFRTCLTRKSGSRGK